jgi:hypothetical protein
VALALALAAAPARATETPAPVRTEIEALLDRLALSGCRFQRNGTWHEAAEARSHLLRKLAVIERRGTLGSTEQFIDLAATRSSVSGRPYAVACANASANEASDTWLRRQLTALRGTTRGR